METIEARAKAWHIWLPAVAGPLAMGLVAAWHARTWESLGLAAALPLAAFVLFWVTVPGLYIGTALYGTAPSITALWQTMAKALGRAGVLLLGCAPASLFLVATSQTPLALSLFVGLPLAGAGLVFMRVLYNGLYAQPLDVSSLAPPSMPPPRFLFVGWASVTLLIGIRLFLAAMESA